jgi:hypothetical protein
MARRRRLGQDPPFRIEIASRISGTGGTAGTAQARRHLRVGPMGGVYQYHLVL